MNHTSLYRRAILIGLRRKRPYNNAISTKPDIIISGLVLINYLNGSGTKFSAPVQEDEIESRLGHLSRLGQLRHRLILLGR